MDEPLFAVYMTMPARVMLTREADSKARRCQRTVSGQFVVMILHVSLQCLKLNNQSIA
jgi:hypothetical protein